MTVQNYFEADTEFIAAHYQPALLVDLALQRDVSSHDLLRGVRLNLQQIKSAQKYISPGQFLTLIQNVQKHMGSTDASFLFGQMVLPGMYGAVSQALQQMQNARQVIEHLCAYRTLLSPLFTPRFFENEKYFFIYWQDSSGGSEQMRFLVESSMMSVVSLINWMSGEKLPWQFQFDYSEPKYIEQYWVNFGEQLNFNQQMNMLVISKQFVDKKWSTVTTIGSEASINASRFQLSQLAFEKSFLEQVYDYMMLNIHRPLNLDRLSFAFSMSPASMKRKLKKHNSSFQEQWDLVRKNTAIYLFHVNNFTYQQIAEHLCFNDMNNFRRAFKRWTGFSPSNLLTELSVSG